MENFSLAMNMLREHFEEGSTMWLILFGILSGLTAVLFFRVSHVYAKRVKESVNFLAFSVTVFIWAFLILSGPLLGSNNGEGTLVGLVISCADFLIPTLLMFQIWSQVSYRPVTAGVRILWLIVPIVLTIAVAVKILMPGIDVGFVRILEEQVSLITFVANIYFIIVVIKSYLLCFNVLYQMPPHMRQSTHQMIIAVTMIVLAHGIVVYFRFTQDILLVLFAVAYVIAVYTVYTAFIIANAENVIVTSRDFVFSNLSTLVLIVSNKGHILDWNRKQKDACMPLPDPKYKEPYRHYRKRIQETCNGTISPHDENILNIKGEDSETNYLFTWHEIYYLDHKFGYLIEIADVTNVYNKLSYIEGIAYYDNLTGLYNRNAYIEQVKEISKGDYMPLLIVIGDINNLKKINDQLGHLNGDKLLLIVTQTVKKHAPEDAFIARIGGDELVILVAKATTAKANDFIASVTEALNAIDDPVIGTPSISWGYSIMRDTTYDYNDVFRDADAIMYEAKRKSREVTISGVVPPSIVE